MTNNRGNSDKSYFVKNVIHDFFELFQPPLLHQINEATRKPGELRLKIRSLTGSTVYLVHVSIDESMMKLYELLDKAMKASGYKGYKVLLSG